MKKILIYIFGIILFSISLEPLYGQERVYVRGYFRDNGTYVKPHYRTAPDGNFYNNWSTYGNVNPYTGEPGTKRYPQSRNYNSYESNYDDLNLAPAPIPKRYNLPKKPSREYDSDNYPGSNVNINSKNYSNRKKLEYTPSSESAKMPENIKEKIFDIAERKWSDNYQMQKYTIEKNIKGYRELNTLDNQAKKIGFKKNLIEWIFNEAEIKWPEDYSMQAYTVEKNLSGFLKASALISSEEWINLPKTVSKWILDITFTKWGSDLSMVAYRLENEIDGFYKLEKLKEQMQPISSKKKERILSIARNKWPQNLSMQAYSVENELESFKALERLRDQY